MALLQDGGQLTIDHPSLIDVTRGSGRINSVNVADNDLTDEQHLLFEADEASQLILIHTLPG